MRKILLSFAFVLGLVSLSHASGANVCNITVSTATQCAVGAGTLYQVDFAASAAAGNYVVCMDTGSITGMTFTGTSGNALNPQLAYIVNTSTPSMNVLAGNPRKFSTGLACTEVGAGGVANAVYLIQQ